MRATSRLIALFIAVASCGESEDPGEVELRPGEWTTTPGTITKNTCTGLDTWSPIDFTLESLGEDQLKITSSRMSTECTREGVDITCTEAAGPPYKKAPLDVRITHYYRYSGVVESATDIAFTEVRRMECTGPDCDALAELADYPPLPCTVTQKYDAYIVPED